MPGAPRRPQPSLHRSHDILHVLRRPLPRHRSDIQYQHPAPLVGQRGEKAFRREGGRRIRRRGRVRIEPHAACDPHRTVGVVRVCDNQNTSHVRRIKRGIGTAGVITGGLGDDQIRFHPLPDQVLPSHLCLGEAVTGQFPTDDIHPLALMLTPQLRGVPQPGGELP